MALNFVFYRFWKTVNEFGGRQLSEQKNIEYALSDAFDKSYAPQRVYVISWAIVFIMSVAGVVISGGLDFENEDLTALRWVQTMVSVVPLYIFWVDSWRGQETLRLDSNFYISFHLILAGIVSLIQKYGGVSLQRTKREGCYGQEPMESLTNKAL